jgi:hypothetical protein
VKSTWFDTATDGGPTGLKLINMPPRTSDISNPLDADIILFLSNHSILGYLKNNDYQPDIHSPKYEGEELDVYQVTPTA